MELHAKPGQILLPDQAYLNSDWRRHQMAPHRHGVLELNFILYGSCDYIVEGALFPAHRHDLVVIDSSRLHRKIFNHSVPCSILGCALELSEVSFMATPAVQLLQLCPPLAELVAQLDRARIFPRAQAIRPALEKISDKRETEAELWRASVYTAELLLELATLVGPPAERRDSVAQICRYVEGHFNEIESVADIAAHVGLNPVYAERIFKAAQRHTLWEYVTALRLERARVLLTESTAPVETIARRTGMRTPQNFYRQFKKHFGMSPGEYRRRV